MNNSLEINPLFSEVKQLIEQSRQRISVSVNAEITLLYWSIGERLKHQILNNSKPEYGQQVISTLSKQLTEAFGSGWSTRQLFYCIKTVDTFPDRNILHTVCAKLSWSHLRLIMAIDDPLRREFYIEICKVEKWSVRTLKERIQSMEGEILQSV